MDCREVSHHKVIDGVTHITYCDGSKEKIYPDGSRKVTNELGDVTEYPAESTDESKG